VRCFIAALKIDRAGKPTAKADVDLDARKLTKLTTESWQILARRMLSPSQDHQDQAMEQLSQRLRAIEKTLR